MNAIEYIGTLRSAAVAKRAASPVGRAKTKAKARTKREEEIARLSFQIELDQLAAGMDCVGVVAERCFRKWAEVKYQAKLLRGGWPDYLLRDANGKAFAVEVKSKRDRISATQATCFEWLEEVSLPVFVWSPLNPTALVPWRVYLAKYKRK